MSTERDSVHDVLSSLRTSAPPPAAYAALRGARHEPATPASPRRRRPATRTLAVAAALLIVGGTATAAVTASGPFSALESSATPGTPAAHNLGILLEPLGRRPEAPDARSDDPGAARNPVRALDPGRGTVRGTTVTRDGVSIDVALNDTKVCLGIAGPRHPTAPRGRPAERPDRERALPPLATVPRGTDPAALACFPRSAARELPSIGGRDADGAWLAAIVPDGVQQVTVTADGGRSTTPTVTDNVAIASFPGAERIETLSWTGPDGTRTTQELAVTPGYAVRTTRRPDLR